MHTYTYPDIKHLYKQRISLYTFSVTDNSNNMLCQKNQTLKIKLKSQIQTLLN